MGEEQRDRGNRTSIKGRVWRHFLFKFFLSLGTLTLSERKKVFPVLLGSSGCSKRETDMRLKHWVLLPGALKSSSTIVLYVSAERLHQEARGQIRSDLLDLDTFEAYKQMPKNSVGYSFITERKVGRGRRPPLSFLSRRHASIISSSPRLGKGVFLSLHGKAKFTNYCHLCVQRACPRDHSLTELTGQGVGLMPPLFYCLGQGWYFCMVLLLSKPAWFCG